MSTLSLPSFDEVMARAAPQQTILNRPVVPTYDRRGDTVLATLARPVIPPEAIEQRPTGSIPYLAERRRLELMLLPRLMHRIIEGDRNGGTSQPDHPDVMKVKALLADAMVEPINGLPAKQAEKLLNRMNRQQMKIFAEAFGPKMKRDKVAAILWHAIRILLDKETIELYEGSSMADALQIMMPMFEHVLDNERQDQSAQKQARKFIEYLNREGYYRHG